MPTSPHSLLQAWVAQRTQSSLLLIARLQAVKCTDTGLSVLVAAKVVHRTPGSLALGKHTVAPPSMILSDNGSEPCDHLVVVAAASNTACMTKSYMKPPGVRQLCGVDVPDVRPVPEEPRPQKLRRHACPL